MEKRELEVMLKYYVGISKVPLIWEEDMRKLHEEKIIRKIYEVVDNDCNETWYLIRDKKEKSYIVKPKFGMYFAKDMMKKYQKFYKFYTVDINIIKMFEKGIYPIVFKVNRSFFYRHYDFEKNTSSTYFNCYYFFSFGKYRVVRKYNNKVEYEIFDEELPAIAWACDFSKNKWQILTETSISPKILDNVYEFTNKKG